MKRTFLYVPIIIVAFVLLMNALFLSSPFCQRREVTGE